jgi:hypothetical protein
MVVGLRALPWPSCLRKAAVIGRVHWSGWSEPAAEWKKVRKVSRSRRFALKVLSEDAPASKPR